MMTPGALASYPASGNETAEAAPLRRSDVLRG